MLMLSSLGCERWERERGEESEPESTSPERLIFDVHISTLVVEDC